MTADEWESSQKPERMLSAVSAKASGRKLRLFACACCRLLWDQILDKKLRAAVEAAEAFSDGRLDTAAFHTAVGQVRDFSELSRLANLEGASSDSGLAAAEVVQGAMLGNPTLGAPHTLRWANWLILNPVPEVECYRQAKEQFESRAADALREMIGPLSHPLVLMPTPMLRDYGGPAAAFRSRVSGTARAVAEGIADDLAFDRLPILADALEDTGLDDRPVLDHLRYGTGHVRGCWALDLVLGRA